MRKGCTLIVKKMWSKYSQWRSFSESKPVPCTNSFRNKRLSILDSCMANLTKLHVMFSSSTFIRLNKDAFNGHLCETVNNCFSIFHRTIWGANKSLNVIYLSPFIGTFILWDVDNLLLRLISEEHRQSMIDSTRKL